MIVLIDNYDSFAYNLYQLIGSIDRNIQVIRNDQLTIEQLEKMKPSAIIISPGPGRPNDAGNIEEVVRYFYNKVPILGVCLGHQAIIEAFGGKIIYAKELMHGKSSNIIIDQISPIFQGVENTQVARYHSLAGDKESLPRELKVIASSEDGEIMAVQHSQYPVYGLQFHPESILTKQGTIMIQNFLGVRGND